MIKGIVVRRSLLASLLMLAAATCMAADLQMRVDRKRMGLDEVLNAQLVAEGEGQGDPDFSPLMTDFEVLSQGQSQVTSIVNGKMSRSRQWTLQLAPKRQGSLTIPAIAVGADRSEPVAIEVGGSGERAASEGPKPLFLRAEADSARLYVQQPLDYRVKVYFRQEPQRAVLSEPEAEGATIERLGEDRSYDDYVDGILYRVIERRYRVIPQHSGTLGIRGPRLEAMVPDPGRGPRQDPFADLDEAFGGTLFRGFPQIPGVTHPGRRVVERAQDISVEVQGQPADADPSWLPATSVQLTDEWNPNPPVFRVGEPVTRTLTITAQGTSTAQLPNLDLGDVRGLQIYPDQPQAEDLQGGGPPTAIKTFKLALVPTRAGTLVLPEVRLPWWDTAADAARAAVIPARTVEVSPGSASRDVPSQQPGAPIAQTSDPAGEGPAQSGAPLDSPQRDASLGLWPWLALALGLGWGATLVWWLIDRRRRRPVEAAPSSSKPAAAPPESETLKAAKGAVSKACAAQDPRAARSALIDWGRLRWPEDPPTGLDGLADRIDGGEEIRAILQSIDRAIYAPPGSRWDGEAAWEKLRPYLDLDRSGRAEATSADLPELYPGT